MSLAREKFLKRKRELLGNINLLDTEEKVRKEEKKNENERQSDQKKERKIEKDGKRYKSEDQRKEREEKHDVLATNNKEDSKRRNDLSRKKTNRKESSNSLDSREEYKESKRTSKWHKHESNTNYSNFDEKHPNKKGSKTSQYSNRQLNQLKRNPLRENEYEHMYHSNEKGDFDKSSKHVDASPKEENEKEVAVMKYRKTNQLANIEYLINMNNFEINNSGKLLIYVCKLILHMCGKKNFQQKSVNTSFTSVEILREIKSKHRKNIKLLKIPVLNTILFYLSKSSGDIGENESEGEEKYMNKEERDLFQKHTEIKIKEKCIEIEHIGINVIIKKVYIKSVIHLLSNYMRCMNEQHVDKKEEPSVSKKALCHPAPPKEKFQQPSPTSVLTPNVPMTSASISHPNPQPILQPLTQPIPQQFPQQMSQQMSPPPPPPPPPPLLPPPPPPPPSVASMSTGNVLGTVNINEMEFGSTEGDREMMHHVGNKSNSVFSGLVPNNLKNANLGNRSSDVHLNDHDAIKNKENGNKNKKINYLENLLNEPTAKEKKRKEEKTNILSILEAPTVIEEMRIKKFQKKNDSVKIICPHLTKSICQKYSKDCNKIHFKKIISEHTDVTLGDCSYLDTCRHIETCKFVHYAVDKEDQMATNAQKGDMQESKSSNNASNSRISLYNSLNVDQGYAPQWIRCDLRHFDLSIFNQYVSVVMADPPWDIHMDLPYGTMTDNEMKHLPVQLIQDEGMIFLWVTGRAMELARECLQIWGYKRVEEILWVKTNHLQRIIRTGRTGHWLNHSKEHCLVGVKGNPLVNRNIDCNVIVSEVRETSRKPDEIYSIIERLCPQNLKIELFGRPHNCRNNWITLGNQLNGVVLHHPQIKERYNRAAPQYNLPLCE